MQLTRRSFLRLSAAGAAAVTLPFGGTGCAPGGLVRDVALEGNDTLVFFADDLSFVVDQRRHRVVVRDATNGKETVLGGFGLEGAGLNFPTDLAVSDDRALVFVADRGNHRVQVYRRDGGWVGQLGTGFGSGAGQLSYPAAVAVVGTEVLVADTGNHRLQRFAFDGRSLGTFGEEHLSAPVAVTLAADGKIHVVSAGDRSVHVYERSGAFVRRYGQDVLVHPRALLAGADGETYVGDAAQPGVLVFADGRLVERLAETGNHGVVQLAFTPDGAVRAAANLA